MVNTPYLGGSSTLLKAPREIRNRIYDFVFHCDSDHPVEVRGVHPQARMISIGLDDRQSPDEVLALLHVNHQISTEAAYRFYRKRTFSGHSEDLIVFVRGVGQRRKLLRKVKIHESCRLFGDYLVHLRDLISDLSTFGALASFHFHMSEYDYGYQSVKQYLIENGIHKLGCELEVRNEYSSIRLESSPNGSARTIVRFSNCWTCAKNSLEWKGGKLHCQTTARFLPDGRPYVLVPEPRMELCDHIHEIS